jgi:tetratricopeptide (TPR) repeat protein
MIKLFLVKSKLVVFIGFAVLFTSCSDTNGESSNRLETEVASEAKVTTFTPTSLGKEISDLEQDLDMKNSPNRMEKTTELITFYSSYFDLFPNDSMTADMLFRAGNECVNLGRYDDALSFYNRLDVSYRNYQKCPESLYLQGFIYDTYKNEFGNAKEKYERLIKLYPEHILASQARVSIENLGLTDEELIRKFEENQ